MNAAQVYYKITTNLGAFVVELFPEKAPETVANFERYAQSEHYVGCVFNRVIEDFMIQGGGYTVDGTKKRTFAPIKNEAANGLSNLFGTIAMARHEEPDSATCQFFINLSDNRHLDERADFRGYAVFGQVVQGLEVIEKIGKSPTCEKGPDRNYPVEDIVINAVEKTTLQCL